MKTKTRLIAEIKELQEQLKELENQEVKRKTIIINDIEYELEQHDNNKMLKDIIIPKGWRLLLPSEAMMLYERGLIDSSFWFYVQQTNKEEDKKGNIARFGANSDGAYLYCYGNPSDTIASLGVLFCRPKKLGGRNENN